VRDYPQPIAIHRLVSLCLSPADERWSRQGNGPAYTSQESGLGSQFDRRSQKSTNARLHEATLRLRDRHVLMC